VSFFDRKGWVERQIEAVVKAVARLLGLEKPHVDEALAVIDGACADMLGMPWEVASRLEVGTLADALGTTTRLALYADLVALRARAYAAEGSDELAAALRTRAIRVYEEALARGHADPQLVHDAIASLQQPAS